MSKITKTDRELSLHADEFVWDTEGCTHVHGFVTGPICQLLKNRKAHQVLDMGCGNGAFSHVLAQHGFAVTGLEHSESGIEVAQSNFPDVQFERYDVNDPLPQSHHNCYDAVVSVEVIEHLLLPRRLIENSLLALKPGGIIILTTPFHGYWKNLALALTNKYDSHWHPLRDFGHIKFFSRATITELFQEFSLLDVSVQTVGRVPTFARSMIASGRKPL